MATIHKIPLNSSRLSCGLLFYLCICSLIFVLQLQAEAMEIDETRRQAVYELSKLKAEANEERAKVLKPGNLSAANQIVGDALRSYRETKSPEALDVLAEVLAPSSESTMIFTVLLELSLDSQTYELLRKFIMESDSRYRGIAVDRLKFAPSALEMNETQVAELLKFLGEIANDPSNSDYRMIGNAERVMRQLEVTPYIGRDRASRESPKPLEAIEESVAKISPAASELVEVVEESAPSKPTIETHTEDAHVEVAEEITEQSSQWWLWLVGLLVLVGGLGLVLRRKN